jgi:shikimate kinase
MADISLENDTNLAASTAVVLAGLGRRSIVLVGMMGAGKSSVGRRLAARLGIPFIDADMEIEKAAGMSIADIFARHGEPSFRSGEARVIARLLETGPQVLATGGGAFMNPGTRAAVAAKGISVWLAADLDVLVRRLGKRRSERPLLQTGDPAETLRGLLAQREPVYAQADITVQSRDVAHDAIVADIVTALTSFLPPAGKAGQEPASQEEAIPAAAIERKVGQ